jgi:ubiquinone/menaquinone biosynthesis C-methylase UbiE
MKNKEKVIDFYNNATEDYEFWSRDYNMHFGLARFNVFNREKMLKKMNQSVLDKVGVMSCNENENFLDMGCGCGGTLRQGSLLNNKVKPNGVTLSKWQIDKCKEIIEKRNIKNVNVVEGDFCKMPYENQSMDGVWALESICHSNNRLEAMKEAYRVLKKGKKFVITDGFVKVNPEKAGYFFRKSYKILCKGWSLPNLANIFDFTSQLEDTGFKIILIKDLSWKIAPSVFHSPVVIIKYLLCNIFKRKPLKKQSIQNLKASFISFFLGIQRSKFSYYQIIVEK